MDIGMLWLDDDKQRSVEEKVERAAEYYREKYGRFPELCFVNQAMVNGEGQTVGNVEVRTSATIYRDHFWLGMKPTNSTGLAH